MYANDNRLMMETQRRAFVLATAACSLLGGIYAWATLERAAGGRLEVAGERINPNTADAASLMRLPNIGPARAEAIIGYRQNVSSGTQAFQRPEDLEEVRGIGPKTVERMRPWLSFD